MTLPTFGPTDEQAFHDAEMFDALAAHPFTTGVRSQLYALMATLQHGPMRAKTWESVRNVLTRRGRPLWRAVEVHNAGFYPNQTPSPYQLLEALSKERVMKEENQ